MKRKKSKHPGSESRRRDIINAALGCFSEIGFSETSMEDIRKCSGASTGSIYHHFKGKEQLAAEIYIEGIRSYQEELIDAVADCQDARGGIRALVSHHMKWIEENQEWARYLFQKRHSAFIASAEEEIMVMNDAFGQSLSKFFLRHIKDGTIKALPADIVISLVFGPCMEFTRQYFSGYSSTAFDKAIRHISEAVWRSLAANEAIL